MIAFFNGEFKDIKDISVSPFDRGFLFADGVYEVVKAYNKKLFRLDDHLERLQNSSKEIKLNPVKGDFIEEIILNLIKKNKELSNNFTVYIQVTRGSYYPRTHSFPQENINPTIFICLNEIANKISSKETKVILEEDIRWGRCNIKSISLLPNILAAQKATEASAYEAVLVKNGFVTEGTHSNFFSVKNNVVITAPLSNEILPGITRKVVLEMCDRLKISVEQRKIKVEELESCDEIFLTSTTMEVKPVSQIEKLRFEAPGKTTQKLINEFKNLVKAS